MVYYVTGERVEGVQENSADICQEGGDLAGSRHSDDLDKRQSGGVDIRRHGMRQDHAGAAVYTRRPRFRRADNRSDAAQENRGDDVVPASV